MFLNIDNAQACGHVQKCCKKKLNKCVTVEINISMWQCKISLQISLAKFTDHIKKAKK